MTAFRGGEVKRNALSECRGEFAVINFEVHDVKGRAIVSIDWNGISGMTIYGSVSLIV
jgi:hypothetical protein